MASWEETLARFEAGDVGADALHSLLADANLPKDAADRVQEALALAGDLGDLWRGRGTTSEHLEALRQKLEELPSPKALSSDPFASLGAAEVHGRRLLAEVVEACGASEGSLWLLDRDAERLVGALNHIRGGGRHEALEGLTVPVSASAIGEVVTRDEPVLIGRADYQDPLATWSSGVDVSAMIAVPLRFEGRVRGVVSAINPIEGRAFDVSDVETLTWKAHLLSLVLQESLRPEPSQWGEPWSGE